MTMQNYAKFESRIAEPINTMNQQIDYWGGSQVYNQGYDGVGNTIIQGVETSLEAIFYIFVLLLFVFGFFLFLYIIISTISKGGKQTSEELKYLGKQTLGILKKFGNFIVNILGFLRKKITIIIIILVIIYIPIFILNTINGQSKIIKMTEIKPGNIGIDFKTSEILEPGKHYYLRYQKNIFISPTLYSFEIAEVTANTQEDMPVTLDYKVEFKFMKNDIVKFYEKYGTLSIQTISSDYVMPNVLESVKGIIKGYGFKDISSQHAKIKEETLAEANKSLKSMRIELDDINVLDIRLPASYLKSIEDLEKAETDKKYTEAMLEKQKKENEIAKEKAKNQKEIKIIEAEGIAKYNEIIKESEKQINTINISNEMIERKKLEIEKTKVEKWDGKLPTTISGKEDIIDIR